MWAVYWLCTIDSARYFDLSVGLGPWKFNLYSCAPVHFKVRLLFICEEEVEFVFSAHFNLELHTWARYFYTCNLGNSRRHCVLHFISDSKRKTYCQLKLYIQRNWFSTNINMFDQIGLVSIEYAQNKPVNTSSCLHNSQHGYFRQTTKHLCPPQHSTPDSVWVSLSATMATLKWKTKTTKCQTAWRKPVDKKKTTVLHKHQHWNRKVI